MGSGGVLSTFLTGGGMRAYVITSGAIFGLLAAAHVLRMAGENARLATDPAYAAITLAAAGMCAWSWRVLRRAGAVG